MIDKTKTNLCILTPGVIISVITSTWCHVLPARGHWSPWMELLLDTSHGDCRGNFCRGEESRDPLERIHRARLSSLVFSCT